MKLRRTKKTVPFLGATRYRHFSYERSLHVGLLKFTLEHTHTHRHTHTHTHTHETAMNSKCSFILILYHIQEQLHQQLRQH